MQNLKRKVWQGDRPRDLLEIVLDFIDRLYDHWPAIVALTLIFVSGCKGSIKTLSSENLSAQYSDNNMTRDNFIVQKAGNDIVVYILLDNSLLEVVDGQYSLHQDFSIFYKLTLGYESKQVILSDTISDTESEFLEGRAGVSIKFRVPEAAEKNGILAVYFYNVQLKKSQIIDIPITSSGNQFQFTYLLFDNKSSPGYYPFLLSNDTIVIKGVSHRPERIFATYYAHYFRPALPPMASGGRMADSDFLPDTTFVLFTNQPFSFDKAGLYLLQTDTLSEQGMGIRVFDSRFPKITTPRELVDPLLYITTSDEMNKFVRTKNLKKELDNFWIGLGGNKDFARTMIKKYYSRVQWANQYFTTFKEGWKTDMGMIFIIFGNPETVKRGSGYEVWYYSKNSMAAGAQSFTFNHRPNLFSAKHYELIRNYEYDIYWYTAVEQWRKGLVNK